MVQTPTDTCDRASSEYLQARQRTIDWLRNLQLPPLPVTPAQDPEKYPKLNNKGEIEYEKDGVTPKRLFTGKNPSYLDANGIPHLLCHSQYQKRLPTDKELELWFTHPKNGIGTLGGWNNIIWLDFDVKKFSSSEDCESAALEVVSHIQEQIGREPLLERSHSGGWRIGIRVKQKPNFTNFALAPGGKHVGEALGEGRFTVLAPTIGPSGNPYQSINQVTPPEVEKLAGIGIYPTSLKLNGITNGSKTLVEKQYVRALPGSTIPGVAVPGSIPLEMLGNKTSQNILNGANSTGVCGTQPKIDRSAALATAIQEWYGWENWTSEKGIRVSCDTIILAHYAGSHLGIDSDRVDRILKTVDPIQCHPAASYVGGEASCWKKIHKLDKATFEQRCPAHIKDAIKREWKHKANSEIDNKADSEFSHNVDSSLSNNAVSEFSHKAVSEFNNNRADESSKSIQHSSDSSSETKKNLVSQSSLFEFKSDEPLSVSDSECSLSEQKKCSLALLQADHLSQQMSQQIDEILNRNLDDSEQDIAFLQLAQDWGRSKREIREIAEKRVVERELQDTRSERLKDIQRLEQLEKVQLDLEDFLHPNLAKPLKHMVRVRRLRPEFFLAGLLPIVASLIGTKGFVRISRGSDDYQLPSVINVGLVGEASSGKSPVVSALMRPLKQLQKELERQLQQQKADYEAAIKQWESLPKDAKGSKPREEGFITCSDRTLFISEYSREGIVKTHALNSNGLLIYKSELVAIYKAFNQYRNGRGEDEEFFNTLWDGDMIYRVLANSEKVFIPESAVSQLGGTQPSVLLKEMGNMEDANGRWARYLWVLAPLERRPLSLEPVPDINELLYNIYRRLHFDLSKTIYTLSPEAEKLYLSWHNLLDDKQFSCPQAGLRAVYGKAQGQAARIALALHCLNAVATGELPTVQISGETMKAAIRMMQFFLGQLSIIRSQGESSIKREIGLAAIYREIEKLCVRFEGQADVLTARMVQSARIPQLEGVTAPKIVELFKDIVAMGRAQMKKVKRSWGLVIQSVLGGGDSYPPKTTNPSDECSPSGIVEFVEERLENCQEPEPNQNNGSSHSVELLERRAEVCSGATDECEQNQLMKRKFFSAPSPSHQVSLSSMLPSIPTTDQQPSISTNNSLDLNTTELEEGSGNTVSDQDFQQTTNHDLPQSNQNSFFEKGGMEEFPQNTGNNPLQSNQNEKEDIEKFQENLGNDIPQSSQTECPSKTTLSDFQATVEVCTVIESTYQKGDKVRVISGEPYQVGKIGTITKIDFDHDCPYNVVEEDYNFSAWFAAEQLQPNETVSSNGQLVNSTLHQASSIQYQYCGEHLATGMVELIGKRRSQLCSIEPGTRVFLLDLTHSHPEMMCYVRPIDANNWESGIAVKREDLLVWVNSSCQKI